MGVFDFGTLKFNNEKEYYNALGAFCNSRAFSISYEPNKATGSYADAYRIRKLATTKELIEPIEKAIRNGNRINCNKYVKHILDKHNFVQNGKNFICQNCKNSFATDNIGKERGGCNPIPITTDERIDGENTITITKQFIESYKENF